MKKIEDYLHLYVGCEVSDGEHTMKLLSVGVGGYVAKNREVRSQGVHDRIKPILRPLSSMTDEEKIFVISNYIKPGWTGKQLLEDNDDDWAMRVRHTEHGEKSVYVSKKKFEPWLFQFLLSKGFDLFGLIDAGLAIDNTKL